MKKTIALLVFVSLCTTLQAQTNINAWYKNGQVWIVWQETVPRPDVYEVYTSPLPFTSTTQATKAGQLFYWEWAAGAIREQANNASLNWNVPGPGGTPQMLNTTQGLFVWTPHTTDSLYFAVVKVGDTTAVSGVNLTTDAVQFSYDPVNDPVTCHEQRQLTLNGYPITFWAMWADGREDHWNGRADFPVMANQYKNGHPSMFIVSEATNMDTTGGKRVPASLWLHGGDGQAIQSLPWKRPTVNITPEEGILVAHNDDFVHYVHSGFYGDVFLPGGIEDHHTNTWFFGWSKNLNPCDSNSVVMQGDTIVNYTQRRLEWLNEWLIEHYAVDRHRIHINGHSMGAAGTTALMKTYPLRYATATIFNNGLEGYRNSGEGYNLFGDTVYHNPTNLFRRDGTNVGIREAFNLNDRNAMPRDLPLVRMFHGKNDDNGVMQWDAGVVKEYKKADSLGWGMQLYWSERSHGIDTGVPYNDHWTHGNYDTMQTVRDNVAYEEEKYNNKSFPGFYNHRLDPAAHDPGDGTIGTQSTTGTGDDWGTWGGYHDWSAYTLKDRTDRWRVCAWLTGDEVYTNDNCPDDSLMASVSIRRPQRFKPAEGDTVYWQVQDSATQVVKQQGITIVGEDDLVSIDSVVLLPYPYKRYITFTLNAPMVTSLPQPLLEERNGFQIFPNPCMFSMTVQFPSEEAKRAIWIYDINAIPIMRFDASEREIVLFLQALPMGPYIIVVSPSLETAHFFKI